MKLFSFVIIGLILSACATNNSTEKAEIIDGIQSNEVVVHEFKTLLDSVNLTGSILIFDSKSNTYYSNDFERTTRGFLPASTFKIPNSIFALEEGILENDSSIISWDGQKRRLPLWEKDLTLKAAFHVSCVPCYQEIASKIGLKRMQDHLQKLDYGNMVVDSTSLNMFWLEGESTITQTQQIEFLKRFYYSELPITNRTEEIMKRMMVIEDRPGFKLSGKTGLSLPNGIYNGWFVGYAETTETTYFLATNFEPAAECDLDLFSIYRKALTVKALQIILSIH